MIHEAVCLSLVEVTKKGLQFILAIIQKIVMLVRETSV